VFSEYEVNLSKTYGKSPITQAVCEFQLRSSKEWDWTVPGLVYQEIQSEFPVKREERSFEIRVSPLPGQYVQQQAGSGLAKMHFLTKDELAMVQVGPDLLAVNVMAPYPGWDQYRRLIQRQFEVYLKVANPESFKRIGLRYINQIELPVKAEKGVEFTEYFLYYPHLPENIEQKHGPFFMRVTHVFANERDMMNLALANVSVPSGNLAYVLDIDYALMKPQEVELKRGLDWAQEAHGRIEAMFEACLTDKTRALFGEKK
jgi:uncharacterized protein (TIGR04255 family)